VKAAQAAFVLLVAAAVAKVVADNTAELRDVDLRLRPGWLLLAAPVSFLAGPLLPLAWRRLVAASGHRLAPGAAVRSWYLGQTARYLPTGLVAFASRAVLVSRFGVPQAVTLATVAVELALIVVVGAGLAAACLPSTELAGPLRVLVAGGAVGALALGPWLLRAASGRVRRLDPRRAGGWDVGQLYAAELGFVANQVAKTVAFVVFAAGVLPVAGDDVLLLAGAFNAATTLGTVGITPAGLGVREGVMAALLQGRFGLGDGAALAAAARVWDVGIELVWLAVVRHRTFRDGSTAEPADPGWPSRDGAPG
jgi:glycosyltransferase 2 family protein